MTTSPKSESGPAVTAGPWETDNIAVRSSGPDGRQICLCEITVRGRPYDETYDEAIANANLIAEAGTVYTDTGLTPRQLAEQRDELLAALKGVVVVADRKTVEFDRARAAIASATSAKGGANG